MKITHMRTNHFKNPLGYRLTNACVSWIAEDTYAKKQKFAEITVSLNESFTEIVFDSGKCDDINSLCYELPIKLLPHTRYFWRVKVVADNGETATSETAFFETAKMDEPWIAKWITPNLDKETHPYLKKTFELKKKIKSARAYVCGLGLYELEINGVKIGNELLTPGFHSYDYWLQYQTYDITDSLIEGKNTVTAMLGNGWFKGRFGFDGGYEEIYGDKFLFICEIEAVLEDKSKVTILSDESWESHASPVLSSGIYDGEIYDANKEIESLSNDCDDGWNCVFSVDYGTEKLTERLNLPVIIKEKIKPQKVIKTPKGETVLDFGQNMTGFVEFENNLKKGKRAHLQYGEVLQNSNFYNDNLRTAKAQFIYTSNGTCCTVRPHFTYYGFRYVKIADYEGDFDPQNFTASVVYSDLETTGYIETSNPLVNRLFKNALWGQKSNFLDVPTDCPQRDERMGWTGDAQIFSATASFNMYTPAFYAKYLTDLEKEQEHLNGSVPFVVPQIKPPFIQGDNPFVLGHGSCAWSDAATVIPWNVYLFYGDKNLLSKEYTIMKSWVDYIKQKDDEDGAKRLFKTGFHFADWLALDNDDKDSPFGGTDCYYVASAYYCYSAELTAKAAAALGKDNDSEKYAKLADEVRTSIKNEYFTEGGKCKINTQTALVLALYMNLVPEKAKSGIILALKEKIKENNMHLDTGFVGTPYLCRVLSLFGANDYAYTLLLNDDFPSWLYEVKLGATTIWERWNSLLADGSISGTGMNSLNHYAYGSIAEWMYREMCGINPVEDAPGFKHFLLKPKPDERIKFANAKFTSPSGLIESSWKYVGKKKLCFNFTIPFDTESDVILPAKKTDKVFINGKLIENRNTSENNFNLSLASGKYEITVEKE